MIQKKILGFTFSKKDVEYVRLNNEFKVPILKSDT